MAAKMNKISLFDNFLLIFEMAPLLELQDIF